MTTGAPRSAISIDTLSAHHWPAVARIYAEGIASGDSTFETEVPEWEVWDSAHLAAHRFVASRGDEVIGWAAVTPVSARRVYAGVVEDGIYVSSSAQGQGIGTQLLEHLITSTEADGIWTIQAAMFPENAASIRLHERSGFVTVGRRTRLARLEGRWRDVILMERRSQHVV